MSRQWLLALDADVEFTFLVNKFVWKSGFRKTQVFFKKKPNPGGFFGVLSGFNGFWVLLFFFGRAVPVAV